MAAARFSLKFNQLQKWRAALKWVWTEAWTAVYNLKLRIGLKRSIARSLRLNGWCEFSALLLSWCPVSCRSALPIAFVAAP
jgi:hypothetical protein